MYRTNSYSEYEVIIIGEDHKNISTSFKHCMGLPILLYVCSVLKFHILGSLLKVTQPEYVWAAAI